MPRYAPQSLPAAGSRPPVHQGTNPDGAGESLPEIHPAIQLGQHIRRERGIQGVQRYVASMREHLGEDEFEQLCSALGVPPDIQPPAPRRAPPPVQHETAPIPQQQNTQQFQQLLPMLMGMMNGQGGSMAPAASGGFNPAMISQLMQMMQFMGGMPGGMPGGNTAQGMNGMNPVMLAQMLQAMQQK